MALGLALLGCTPVDPCDGISRGANARCVGPDAYGSYGWGAAVACQADMACDVDGLRCMPNAPAAVFPLQRCLSQGQLLCTSSSKYREAAADHTLLSAASACPGGVARVSYLRRRERRRCSAET